MLKPLRDNVVVEPRSGEDKSPGGIIIPDSAKSKPQEGVVLAVGSGKLLDNGEIAAMEVAAGDVVIFSKYGGSDVKIDNKDVVILSQDAILGIKEED